LARKRSEFVRRTFQQVLDAEVERRMADAYVRQPDNPERDVIDPEVWEPRKAGPRRRRPCR
jgi:hypothetical protein